jgi:hypothetical protein
MADYSDCWYSPAERAADDARDRANAHYGQLLVVTPSGARMVSTRNLQPGDSVTDALPASTKRKRSTEGPHT